MGCEAGEQQVPLFQVKLGIALKLVEGGVRTVLVDDLVSAKDWRQARVHRFPLKLNGGDVGDIPQALFRRLASQAPDGEPLKPVVAAANGMTEDQHPRSGTVHDGKKYDQFVQ